MIKGHALLTGALGGLGTAMTVALSEAGIPIVAADRRKEDFEPWRDSLPEIARDNVSFYPLDVTREEQVDELAAVLESQDTHIAYLINNAGIQGAARPWEMTTKTWDRVMRVNINGTFFLTRAFSKNMVEAGFGRIVNVASLFAYHPGKGQGPYAAGKAAITGYTRSSALDLASSGVTVNAIAPGYIWHERLAAVFPGDSSEPSFDEVPMKRSGKPEEIAATVAFLVSDGAAYITGQTIHVNGGLYLPG
ncbi:MAG: SDR family oxidoreductase [Pseudomonadales bacterium]|nr:SDR family oxidoreductase [Pseudomonadales bacterium]